MKKTIIIVSLIIVTIGNLLAQENRSFQKIDLNETRQTMFGWGISSAFHPARLIYERIPEATRDSLFDLMFTEKGADLSVFRTQIEPEYDYKTWADEVDKYQYLIMQEARKRGVEDFLATPWSPPGEFKANGKAAPGDDEEALSKNYLLADKYQDYADYLVRYIKGYKERRGIEFNAFSIQNEPDMNYIWNTCFFYPGMLADLINVVGKTFKVEGIDLLFLAPECGGWDLTKQYADTIFADETAGDYLDGISTHGYKSSSQRSEVAQIAAENGLAHIWQTESSDYNENITEPDDGIENGIRWANIVALDINEGGANAWFYWWMVVFSAKDGQGLLRWSGGELTVPKRFWAAAHYSRFIKKGWRRVEIESEQDKSNNMNYSAFLSPKSDSLALVLINIPGAPANASFVLPALREDVYSADLWLTDANTNLTKPAASFAKPSRNALRFDSIPAKSITTVICRLPEAFSPSIELYNPGESVEIRAGEETAFEWESVECDKYRISISESPDLSVEEGLKRFESTEAEFNFAPGKLGEKYYWLIDAIEIDGGEERIIASSELGNFETLPEPPGLVKIMGPREKDSIELGETVTFFWFRASKEDLAYNLVISESDDITDETSYILDSVSESSRIRFDGFPVAKTYYWAVSASNKGGFGEFTEARSLIVAEPVSVLEPNINYCNVNVYPNPTREMIQFETPFIPKSVTILDAFGRSRMEIAPTAKSVRVDILPSGVYLLRFEYLDKIIFKRFIKF